MNPRFWTAAAVALLLLVFANVAPAVVVPDVSGWRLVWHDEFEGSALDQTKWEALDRRDSHNNEKQYYHPDQVVVADGLLQITAIDQPRAGKQYQSGLLVSRQIFGPGRFEARVDLPTSQGMWPAFWLNANHVAWPQGGEIDILENRGSQPNLTSSAYHWQTDPGPCCGQHQYVYDEYTAADAGAPVDFHTGFHTFAAEWDETLLRFFVDGDLYFTVTETPNRPIFETAKNIIVNLAVGGDFGGDPNQTTIWPQTMYVDYVRYWNRMYPSELAGDYNNDGAVDAADYTIWRSTTGDQGIGLAADGSGNGAVGTSDYQAWRQNYQGASTGVAGASVPAPTGAAFTLVLSVAGLWRRRR
ncbi:Glucan endo-1,3-beta-glucosidase A1 precursor [Posidoniimonas polymericola]|uniref:Glucan endo-1,3-beta-glucosidase A1 n=1 Tax=Posidoniimonas polymericola TaxID=2528002 RepID=A0A5C5XWR6_9BACT|nr:family 16 glycosylhydrolase [Posidoniimonas polymericola]TWT66763.1 Glucan endo-1,3-beta-glucosidase A1 precursor [Posidoniimonas polymericola]